MKATPRRVFSILGVLAMLIGAIMVIVPSVGASSGEFPEDGTHKVPICHRTNSVTNPYVMPTVDIDAVTGTVENGPNHYEHGGEPFDFDAADYDVRYPTPRNGDQWGDIIPPVPLFNQDGTPLLGEDEQPLWTTGLNWTDVGQAIYENGCQATDEGRAAVIVAKEVPGVVSTDLFRFTVNGSTPPTRSVMGTPRSSRSIPGPSRSRRTSRTPPVTRWPELPAHGHRAATRMAPR